MTPRLSIIDTNVLVAGLITSQPSSSTVQVLDAMLDGRLLYLLSPALLGEYRHVRCCWGRNKPERYQFRAFRVIPWLLQLSTFH
jgi:hypothetical protein